MKDYENGCMGDWGIRTIIVMKKNMQGPFFLHGTNHHDVGTPKQKSKGPYQVPGMSLEVQSTWTRRFMLCHDHGWVQMVRGGHGFLVIAVEYGWSRRTSVCCSPVYGSSSSLRFGCGPVCTKSCNRENFEGGGSRCVGVAMKVTFLPFTTR